jgi:predicted nucleic acid-binding protein
VIVLDTTVLSYAVGGSHPLRDPARRFVSALRAGGVQATTTPDVLQEFVHTYSRRRPRTTAVSHARQWLTLLTPMLTTTQEDIPVALRLFGRHERLDAFDAVLAAVALREQASALVSADRAFAGVPKLPFVELGSDAFDRLVDA